jgi:DNA-directed RNA polymerase specialized sigma24 family protein
MDPNDLGDASQAQITPSDIVEALQSLLQTGRITRFEAAVFALHVIEGYTLQELADRHSTTTTRGYRALRSACNELRRVIVTAA